MTNRWTWIAATALASCIVALAATIALAHEAVVNSCVELSGKTVNAVKLYEARLPNGLLAEVYAIKVGGGPRVITYTPLEGDKHGRLPLFIDVDTDGDFYPDLLLIHLKNAGTCDDYIVYENYNQPGEHVAPDVMPHLQTRSYYESDKIS